MGSSVEVMRGRYAAARRSSGLSSAAFREKAGRLAHELADGEEIQPYHWAQAAEEVSYVAKGGK